MRGRPTLKFFVLLVAALAAAAVMPSAVSHAAPRPAAATASLSTFAGTWTGHERDLKITKTGHAKEFVGAGCCDPVIKMKLTLSDVAGTAKKATATGTVTKVKVLDHHSYNKKHPAPKVGDTATVALKHGIINEPLVGMFYCDSTQEAKGQCGA